MEDKNPNRIELSRRNSVDQNRKIREAWLWNSPEIKKMRESMQRQFGIDIRDKEKFGIGTDKFSFNKFREKVFRETNTSSAQAQLLRAGVQTAVNNLYPAVKTTYEQWTHVIPSKRDTELYAPLNALTFLEEIGQNARYPEASVIGLDLEIRNRKFGEMMPVSFELIDDDQTGQFSQKVGEMAEYAALLWEVWCYGKLASISTGVTYGRLKVSPTETTPSYESHYPWAASTGTLKGGGITRPTSFGALSQANLQTAFTTLENQLNLQGLKMAVNPDTIACGPYNRWTLATLLNSNFYPSGAQAAGTVGGALAVNVLQGIGEPVISRFMPTNASGNVGSVNANSTAWYIMDSSKPWFVVQMREAASVTQENPETGAGFERDVYRWKLRVRGNADFIDPRFAFQGSDGTA